MSNTMITITGNLGEAPELRTAGTGKTMARLRVATNRRRRDAAGTWSQQTDWHTVVVWDTLAEAVADLTKGTAVIVHRRLSQREWTPSDGQKRTVWEITAEHIGTVLSRRWDSEARPTSRGRGQDRDRGGDRDQGRGREQELDWDADAA
jgi:single-strand DNA-binding protein